jgi:hypothetical protein
MQLNRQREGVLMLTYLALLFLAALNTYAYAAKGDPFCAAAAVFFSLLTLSVVIAKSGRGV